MTGGELAIIIGAFLPGIAGLITAIMAGRNAASKSQVEILTDTLSTLQIENKRLVERVEHLEQEREDLACELDNLKTWAAMLVGQVIQLGGKPASMPEKTRPHKRGTQS